MPLLGIGILKLALEACGKRGCCENLTAGLNHPNLRSLSIESQKKKTPSDISGPG